MVSQPRPLPAPIPPGAKIGVVALAGPPDLQALHGGIEWLQARGFEVVVAPNVTARIGYLAGTDEERLAGLSMLLDQDVEVLLAARGGYGVMRLLPNLPWARLAAWRGWVVGFSDITAWHSGLATRFPCASLHGPVATSLCRDQTGAELMLSWLAGRAPTELFQVRREQVVQAGAVRGVSVGGTLSLLASLAGTPFEPDYDGAVLFVEDVGEPLYRLDRLLTQLKLSSRLARVKAVVAGRLARCGRGEKDWRERWREMLVEAVPPDAVVVSGLPFGHGGISVPFPLGVEVEVDTDRGLIALGGA